MNKSKVKAIVTAESKFIIDIFTETSALWIPAYQRPYSWQKREADELWNDLINHFSDERQHFLGPMYFKPQTIKTDQVLEVTDGQQRITSIFLLLMAFKRLLKVDFSNPLLQENVTLREIERRILETTRKNDKSRLQLGASDKYSFEYITEYFETIPLRIDDYKQIFRKDNKLFLKSTRLLYENFFVFYKNLKSMVEEDYKISTYYKPGKANLNYLQFQKEELSKIENLLYFLLNRFSIIKCIVDTPDDQTRVFQLFETINDRGRQLDQIDKVKNLLFMNIFNHFDNYEPDKKQETYDLIQQKWADIQTSLDIYIEEYLRYLLIGSNSLGQYIKVNELFDVIKSYFDVHIVRNIKKDANFDYNKSLKFSEFSWDIINMMHKYRENYSILIDPELASPNYIKDKIVRANIKYAEDYKIVRAIQLKLLMDHQDIPNSDRLRRLFIVTTNFALLYVGIYELKKMDNVESEIYKNLFVEFTDKNLLNNCIDFSDRVYKSMSKVSTKFVFDEGTMLSKIENCTNDQVSFYLQCKLNDYKESHNKTSNYFYTRVFNDTTHGQCLNKDHILPKRPKASYQMEIDAYYLESGIEPLNEKKFQKEVISSIGNIIPIMRDTNMAIGNGQHMPFFKSLPIKGILLKELVDSYDDVKTWLPNHISLRAHTIAQEILNEKALTVNEEEAEF